MSNKKQTAVEWLVSALQENEYIFFDGKPHDYSLIELIAEAKELEKQQMISFGYTQIQYIDAEIGDLIYQKVPEEIYTETYEGNK